MTGTNNALMLGVGVVALLLVVFLAWWFSKGKKDDPETPLVRCLRTCTANTHSCVNNECRQKNAVLLANGKYGVCPAGTSPSRPTLHAHSSLGRYLGAGATLSNHCIGQTLVNPPTQWPTLPGTKYDYIVPPGNGAMSMPVPLGTTPKMMRWDGGLVVYEPIAETRGDSAV
jgi:Co/Zn/Cd efflux system component